MAKQTIVKLIDDLDGGAAAESICFAYAGTEYTIDLSKKNATKLRKDLAPFVENGARVTVSRARSTGNRARRDSVPIEDTPAGRAMIRTWARTSGQFPGLSDRGRLPVEVVAAYRKANNPQQ